MSNIKAIDFAQNVEQNRQLLIQHCNENGQRVSDSNSLSEIVSANNSINENYTSAGHRVEFRDIDAELVEPAQFVADGEDAVLPATNPSFDSDYIEFVEWYSDGNLTGVTEDVLSLPLYRVKYDSETQQRPTYLFFNFTSQLLSPQLRLSGTSYYVDWGDGTTPTSNTNTHTYSSAGYYVIKIWSDSGTTYSLGSSGSSQLSFLANGNNEYILSALKKAYIGENAKLNSYAFFRNQGLEYFVLPEGSGYGTSFTSPFYYCFKLKTIIFPAGSKMIGSGGSGFYSSISTDGKTYSSSLNNGLWSLNTGYLKYVMFGNNAVDFTNWGLYYMGSALRRAKVNSTTTTNTNLTLCFNYDLEQLPLPKENIAYLTVVGNTKCKEFENINFPNLSSLVVSCNTQVKSIFIPANCNFFQSSSTYYPACGGRCPNLSVITLANDYDKVLTIYADNLSKASLIQIANALKDNTGATAKTLKVSSYLMQQMTAIYVDANGLETSSSTTGAMNLVQFITAKNWTVS